MRLEQVGLDYWCMSMIIENVISQHPKDPQPMILCQNHKTKLQVPCSCPAGLSWWGVVWLISLRWCSMTQLPQGQWACSVLHYFINCTVDLISYWTLQRQKTKEDKISIEEVLSINTLGLEGQMYGIYSGKDATSFLFCLF